MKSKTELACDEMGEFLTQPRTGSEVLKKKAEIESRNGLTKSEIVCIYRAHAGRESHYILVEMRDKIP
jgi:hypothetical protein